MLYWLPKAMKTLIIDTSSEYCILALAEGDCILEHALFLHENQLSQTLLPQIDELLQRAALPLKMIKRIAVGVGPGSYTGTRIGVAVARSLSYGLQIPLRGFCSLISFLPPLEGHFASVLAAKSGLFFLLKGQSIKKNITIETASLVSLDDLKNALQTADFITSRHREELPNDCLNPDFHPFHPNPQAIAQALQMPSTFPFEAETQLIYLHTPWTYLKNMWLFLKIKTQEWIRQFSWRKYMPSVKVRPGEPIDKALRALKKKLDKEGIMKAAKAHRFYDKPSVKSRAKSKAALKYKKTKPKMFNF